MHGPSSARGQSATNTGLSVTKGEQGHLQHNRAGQVVGCRQAISYSFHCGNDVIGLMQWNKKLCNNLGSSKLDQCSIPKQAGHVHVGASYSYEQL